MTDPHAPLPSALTRLEQLRDDDRAAARAFKRSFFAYAFKAIEFNGISGDYLEFGCHGGMTFTLAWEQIERRNLPAKLWAFDSFEGLPPPASTADQHPRWQPGALATGVESFQAICAAAGIPKERLKIVPGFYDKSLPALAMTGAPKDIALAYIDCDLHSSTTTVLEFLKPRLKHGMILAFDDYFCWSATQLAGERRALVEQFQNDSRWHLHPYLQFGWAGQSFVVESTALLPA